MQDSGNRPETLLRVSTDMAEAPLDARRLPSTMASFTPIIPDVRCPNLAISIHKALAAW